MSEGTHSCPRRGCGRVIPNRLFACRNDWYALSKPTRDRIWATAHLSVVDPERRAAFRLADRDWRQEPGRGDAQAGTREATAGSVGPQHVQDAEAEPTDPDQPTLGGQP